MVPAESKEKNDTSDEAQMRVQATMYAWYEQKGMLYEVRSEVSSDVHAAHAQIDGYMVRPRARAEVQGVARNNTRPTLDHIWAEVEGGG